MLKHKDKIMVDMVVKTHRLNLAIQNLSLAEIRLIQLAIIDSRERNEGLSADKPLYISALRYAKAFNVDNSTAYRVLMDAEKTLFERRFTFLDEREDTVKSRWISQAKYLKSGGGIEIIFTPAVVNEITRIDGAEQFFSQYALDQTAKLNSIYSVRLYELLNQWRTVKKTPLFNLDIFRGQMGLGVNEYKLMSDFKKRVLELAINEINEKTDLTVSYDQQKKGRKITGFKFTVKEKPKTKQPKQDENGRDTDTPDLFHQLTDKQVNYFGAKLASDPVFGSKYAKIGESDKAFEQRIKQELTNPDNQKKWADDLKRIGYNPVPKI